MKLHLTPEDHQHIRAAEGWFELSDHVSAFNELEQVEPQNRMHPPVLKLRFRIYAKAEKWGSAFTIAEGLSRLVPDDVEVFVWRSLAASHVNSAGLQTAFELLLDVVNDFPEEPIVSFNLACYACQLGRIKEANNWWARCLTVAEQNGTEKEWKLRAMEERDLQAIFQ